MSVTFGGWICDAISPWVGQSTAEFLSRVEKRKTFTVHVLDTQNQELTDIKVQLFVQRHSSQVPFLVDETAQKGFHTGYILEYRWAFWPSDETNFSFTLKAVKDDQIATETTLHLDSSRRSERIGTNLRVKPTA